MSHMSNNLDATRLADLARDPHRHGDAATVAHAALRSAQAQRAVLNTAAQAIDVSRRYCYDADYGSYTGSPLDPRTDSSGDSFTSLQPLGDAMVMVMFSWDSNESLSVDGATINGEFVSVDSFSNHVRGQWEKALRAEDAKDAEISGWVE